MVKKVSAKMAARLAKPGRKRITSKTAEVLEAVKLFKKCWAESPGEPETPRERIGDEFNKLSATFLNDLNYCLLKARWGG